jgi:bifunctional isochorismate lyase/aryl carrier protein
MNRPSTSKYVTPRNLPAKTRTWISAVRPYLRPHRREAFPFCPENAALILVDAQKYFFDFASPAFLPAAPAILANLAALKTAFQGRRRPVVWTRQAAASGKTSGLMSRWWKSSILEGDPLAEIADSLRPDRRDTVVTKSRYSAFVGTDLETCLRSTGIERVVIAGVLTHLCCETTARDAFQRDFEVFIALDATASRTEELHLGSLKALADGFARPLTTREILSCFE